MTSNRYPEGWDEERVRKVLDHYEGQTDDESVAEDEDAFDSATHAVMEVPRNLVRAVRELIARGRAV